LFRAAVITVSDKGSSGERKDESGPIVQAMLEEAGYSVVLYEILPDERAQLAERLAGICDRNEAELIVTTGGTGFSPRDRTPEATLDVAERQVPGIPEAMRACGMAKTSRAMLSRAVSALRGRTLIVNLPGSPKAARENLECVLPSLEHGLDILTGRTGDH
jgi:molybdenum cofactor synthesis domain-containing protein